MSRGTAQIAKDCGTRMRPRAAQGPSLFVQRKGPSASPVPDPPLLQVDLASHFKQIHSWPDTMATTSIAQPTASTFSTLPHDKSLPDKYRGAVVEVSSALTLNIHVLIMEFIIRICNFHQHLLFPEKNRSEQRLNSPMTETSRTYRELRRSESPRISTQCGISSQSVNRE